uniref:Uncharacterized protein n=1 Tax=Arundo donax TaxID=35708 RepID=A0A0A9ARX2_ARUDO
MQKFEFGLGIHQQCPHQEHCFPSLQLLIPSNQTVQHLDLLPYGCTLPDWHSQDPDWHSLRKEFSGNQAQLP